MNHRARAGARDVVLKRVHELVAEHVIGGLERTGEGQHDTALVRFGDAAGPLAELPLDDVRLAELRAAAVEDERLSPAEVMAEDRADARVPPLGHPRRHARRGLLFGVVIDVEVIGLEDLEREVAVLHLVLAEVPDLGLGRGNRYQGNAQGGETCGGTGHYSSSRRRRRLQRMYLVSAGTIGR